MLTIAVIILVASKITALERWLKICNYHLQRNLEQFFKLLLNNFWDS